MKMQKATTLEEVPQAMALRPLEGDELDVFYVPTDEVRDPYLLPSKSLRRLLKEDPLPKKLLFASHPGTGKSTELNRLMREEQGDFFFVRLSVDESLDRYAMGHIDLILALMESVYRRGAQENLIRDGKPFEAVNTWLQEVVKETTTKMEGELEAKSGVGVEGIVSQIVGLLASLRSALRLTAESAETVRQVIKPRISRLRLYCNQGLTEIKRNLKGGRRLVVIVEDTDKLDIARAEEIFVKHTGLLANLNATIVYTVPLFLVQSPHWKQLESRFEKLVLPMIETHRPGPERKPVDEGLVVLREIVYRRMDADLITSEALEMAITKTGGVLRDLLKVLTVASTAAINRGENRISGDAVRYSLNRLKTDYRNSVYDPSGKIPTEDLYKKMVEIAKSPGPARMDGSLIHLLYIQAVVEYNGKGWYDVHPLIWESLYDMGEL